MVDSTSLRVLLALAAQCNLAIKTFDVKTAFLYGELEEEMYLSVPEGYNSKGKICKLKKALYGLKQAPNRWNKKLTNFLRNEGLKQTDNDKCIFSSGKDLAIHVDDGILIAKDVNHMSSVLKKLCHEFEISIEDNPKLYLGIEIK